MDIRVDPTVSVTERPDGGDSPIIGSWLPGIGGLVFKDERSEEMGADWVAPCDGLETREIVAGGVIIVCFGKRGEDRERLGFPIGKTVVTAAGIGNGGYERNGLALSPIRSNLLDPRVLLY